MATVEQVRVERRSGHRFEQYQLPVLLRTGDGNTGNGFTLNLSSRGALVRTDFSLAEGQAVEITLVMPSEITMEENTSVRCRARVLRLQSTSANRERFEVALRIEHYEFLPRELVSTHSRPEEIHVV